MRYVLIMMIAMLCMAMAMSTAQRSADVMVSISKILSTR